MDKPEEERKLKLIVGESIKSGLTISCGCHKNKQTAKRNHEKLKINRYDLSGEYGIGYTDKNEEFYFDLEDFDKIKNFHWYINDRGYVTSRINGKRVFFHRLVMNISEPKIYVDHKKHVTVDNRKSQLRLVTPTQNQMNKQLQSNNTSGVPGVCWHSRDQVWAAYITQNGKRIYLGGYYDIEEAIEVRKKAEEKYFKEYSYENSTKLNTKESA